MPPSPPLSSKANLSDVKEDDRVKELAEASWTNASGGHLT